MKNLKIQQNGFSLIEMIVALGLFSVVATIAVGALLTIMSTNTRLQDEQSVMTSLSFALDSMTRELRTGSNYYCSERPNNSAGGSANIFNPSNDLDALGDSTQDCTNARNQRLQGISFIEGGDSLTPVSNRILYFFDDVEKKIMRRLGNGAVQPLVSSNLYIEDMQIYVTGSTAGDGYQPSVTIYVKARDKNDSSAKNYQLQTTVVQRSLDI